MVRCSLQALIGCHEVITDHLIASMCMQLLKTLTDLLFTALHQKPEGDGTHSGGKPIIVFQIFAKL